MKILHISALPIWSMDGKAGMPSLRETIRGHIRAGISVEIILPQYDLFSTDPNEIIVKNDEDLIIHILNCPWLLFIKALKRKLIKTLKTNELPFVLRWMINFTIFILFSISMFYKGFKVGKKLKPDIIYAHNQYSSIAGFLLGKAFSAPNITRLYGTFLADLMNRPFVSLRYPTAAAGYLVPSSLIICTNDGTRGDEVAEKFKIPKKRFRFWQNGIQPPLSNPETSREEIIESNHNLEKKKIWILSCSRLSSWKRIDRMLKGMKLALEKKPDIQLLIAGGGPEKENLTKLVHELEIDGDVAFLGPVSHDRVWGLMNLSDIFMITNDVTNRCNPLFEAAWAGLPVVSVKDPSTFDILSHGKNALLSEKEDIENLGSNILQLASDQDLRKRLQREQQRICDSFYTWEKRMEMETQDIKKLIPPKP